MGVDAARGLAVIGMTMVHVGPNSAEGLGGAIYGFPHGRASVLFVLVAGIGAALLSRTNERRWEARLRLFWIAALFLLIGLGLQSLDHGVAVILQHYTAFYLVALLLIPASSSLLFGLGIATALVGPIAYFVLRRLLSDVVERETVGWGDGLGDVLAGLVLTGPYPVLVWGAIVIWGMWIGRQKLPCASVQWILIVSGIVVAISAEAVSWLALNQVGRPDDSTDWRNLLIADGHSQMPLWLISSIGSATALVGIGLAIGRRWPSAIWPLAALGQVALTYYIAHLVALHFLEDRLRFSDVRHAAPSAMMLAVLGIGFAIAWRRYFRRGPVEWIMARPFDRHRRREASQNPRP